MHTVIYSIPYPYRLYMEDYKVFFYCSITLINIISYHHIRYFLSYKVLT